MQQRTDHSGHVRAAADPHDTSLFVALELSNTNRPKD